MSDSQKEAPLKARVDQPEQVPDTTDTPSSSSDLLPGLDRLISSLEAFVFASPARVFYPVVVLLAVVKNGIWYSGNSAYWLAIARPFPGRPNLPAGERYLAASPLGPALAHLLHATGDLSYGALHLVVLAGAVTVTLVGLERVAGPLAARMGAVALFANPLSNVLLIALGEQDPFTILFLGLLVCFDGIPMALIGGIGLGFEHSEVGAFVVVMFVAARWLRRDTSLIPTAGTGTARLATAIAGVIIGAVGTILLERHMGLNGMQRESVIHQYGLHQLFGDFLDNWPAWVFSVFGAWWLMIAGLWDWMRRQRLLLLAAIWCGAATLVTTITLDETRVFALLTWALVLQVVIMAARSVPSTRLRNLTAATFGIAVILPRTIVFEGATSTANWSPLVERMLHHL